jgi:hypothetical protein
VSAGVKDKLNVRSVRSQLTGESNIGLEERIVAAHVDPDGHLIDRMFAGERKHVMTREVFGVIECSRRQSRCKAELPYIQSRHSRPAAKTVAIVATPSQT